MLMDISPIFYLSLRNSIMFT